MFNTLIVEDNQLFRQSLRQMLVEQFPFLQVTEMGDGEGLFRPGDVLHSDLVFMDVKLPGRNGFELTRIIKSRNTAAIVCVITSYDLPEYRDAAFSSGADYFYTKGELLADEIAKIVEAVLSMRIKTLIVEDDASFRTAMASTLSSCWPSMIVVEAGDGPEGLEDVSILKPNLVLLDLHLPSTNGLDLIRTIKKRLPESTIAVVTAYDLPEYRQAAFITGADYFISKDEGVKSEIVSIVDSLFGG